MPWPRSPLAVLLPRAEAPCARANFTLHWQTELSHTKEAIVHVKRALELLWECRDRRIASAHAENKD
eukprot:1722181-Rhodomonas_salina.1